MKSVIKQVISSKGFVSRKHFNFDKLNVVLWFAQLVLSFVVALS